jgi:hypothetical protein
MTQELRKDLPDDIPPKLLKMPIDRGYPVPYFVCWFNDDGVPMPRGEGKPDFRVISPFVVDECWNDGRCWICGGLIDSRYRSFVIGPMCAVNRTSAEPPSHNDCADWSARACPFLARPHAKRRPVPEELSSKEVPGIMLDRNPGVALVWRTRDPHRFSDGKGGWLFDVGAPTRVDWYAEGRPATREEVTASIDSGLPSLQQLADEEGPDAQHELKRRLEVVEKLLLPPVAA